MIRSISMFSATGDLEEALNLLCATAFGLDRRTEARMNFADCSLRLADAEGHAALVRLARRLGLPPAAVPSLDDLRQMFADEALSMRALKMHRGRNVYSAGKLAIWQRVWEPFRATLVPDDDTIAQLRALIAMDTRPSGPDGERCAKLLIERLTAMGFAVEKHERAGSRPILFAQRAARGLDGKLVIYSHYDASETDPSQWASPPFEVTERGGRLFGLGIGDNKGALALRLQVMEALQATPALTWVIQGDEETGSFFAHELYPSLLASVSPTLWLEENGYHDEDGTQRLLARTIGIAPAANLPPDRYLCGLIEELGIDAATWGVRHRVESRGLNKDFFDGGCPFNRNLPLGARYLAVGINDPRSTIHQPNESVPGWTFALHARQLATVMRWVDRTSRSGA